MYGFVTTLDTWALCVLETQDIRDAKGERKTKFNFKQYPMVREMDFCLSAKDDALAARYLDCKKHAVILQLIIGNPTRSKYAVPTVLEHRYREFVRSQGGPISELDDLLFKNPFLLSSERLEILIGLAAAGNGMNHLTSVEDGGRKWVTTMISSMLSASIKGQEKKGVKFHNVFLRESPGVNSCVQLLRLIAAVRDVVPAFVSILLDNV